jgi:hypothetical protein
MSYDARDREGLILGLTALLILVILDVVLGAPDNFAGAVVVAPVLCAALADLPLVAALGVLTLLASLGLSWYDHSTWVPTAVRAAVTVVGSATAGWVSHRRTLITDRLDRVFHIAEVAQRAILDPLPEQLGPARMAGWYISATEEALIGGDFYHACAYKGRARWMIGDVKGKGVDAVRAAAAAIGAFREAAEQLESLGEVVARVDHRLARYLDDEGFATAIVAELSADGTLRMVNCGHPPPLLLRCGAATVLATRPTTPLGLNPTAHEEELQVEPGDSVWFFTDGVIEARTRQGSRGLLPEKLAAGVRGTAAQVAHTLSRHLEDEAGPELGDDSAALVVEFCPA